MIKLVASDMDGTLLGADGKISNRTANVIKNLLRSGIGFIVCTGRGYEDARLPLQQQEISCDLICMNGAAVYDREGTVIDSHRMDQEQIQYIMSCCDEDVIYDFMTHRGSYTIASKEQFEACFRAGVLLPMAGGITCDYIMSRFSFITQQELFSSGLEFYKMSIIHQEEARLKLIKERLMKDPSLVVVSSHHTNLEVTSRTAQKGVALKEYACRAGIALREIMAIGDSENDRSMLSMPLGYTVAMENGMESIKKIARCQTRSNVDDGVAYAIETLLQEVARKAG